MNNIKVVLASSSPRRMELLHNIVENFAIMHPKCEEVTEGDPKDVALNNAILKAKACNQGDIIIACDTLVAVEGKIYGKPYNVEGAISMLKELNGKWHSVFSGVCVITRDKEITFVEESKVKFNKLTDNQIINYVKEFLPLDKAGSYGIQDGIVVEKYIGDFDNIVGLPTKKLREVLGEFYNVK